MKARKTKQFPLFGGNILDECPDCGSAIVSIGFNRGICPSCARLEILSLRKQMKRLTQRAPDVCNVCGANIISHQIGKPAICSNRACPTRG